MSRKRIYFSMILAAIILATFWYAVLGRFSILHTGLALAPILFAILFVFWDTNSRK